jgi:hypothetical protein
MSFIKIDHKVNNKNRSEKLCMNRDDQVYMYVSSTDGASVSTYFQLDLGTVPTVWKFFCFSFYSKV